MRQLASTLLTRKDQEVSAHLLFLGLPNLAMCLKSMPRTQSSALAPSSNLLDTKTGLQHLGWGGGREEKIYM